MKTLQIDMNTDRLGGSVFHREFPYIDHAKAERAYDQVKAALAGYREHGNDRDRTIEIELEAGQATLKIGNVVNVMLVEVATQPEMDIALAIAHRDKALEGRMKAEGGWRDSYGRNGAR